MYSFDICLVFGFDVIKILSFVQEVEQREKIDWFDVIPALTGIPKTSNMASKLCIQLHSFPKDAFENIQKTKILTGQDSEIVSKLEVELRTLVSMFSDVSALQHVAHCMFHSAL
jgi:hypothetical protein